MIEIRTYTYDEMSAILGTRSNQGIKRKLDKYEIECNISGRGCYMKYDIISIAKPFTVCCITELGMPAQTDFYKFRNFLYYFMNDDEFRWLPDEIIESRMHEKDRPISRQTITKYKRRLEKQEIISISGEPYVYYFARKGNLRKTEKEEYRRAWAEYWENRNNGMFASEAIHIMYYNYGGVARKQSIAQLNAFYINKWNKLNELVSNAMEHDSI